MSTGVSTSIHISCAFSLVPFFLSICLISPVLAYLFLLYFIFMCLLFPNETEKESMCIWPGGGEDLGGVG